MTKSAPVQVHTIDDLESTEFPGTALAVVGHPVKHSLSPVLHAAALESLAGKDPRYGDWTYHAFDIEPGDFPRALELFHKRSFLGLNLTVPHKIQALGLVKGISADGQRMGAVNTLMWDELGYDGFNTDGYGLSRAVSTDLDAGFEGAAVVLLGAGGAARAAAVQCLREGCDRLWIGNRSSDRLEALLGVLRELPEGGRAEGFDPSRPPEDLPDSGVLVNATSVGLREDDPSPFDPSSLGAGWRVYDMIYNPVETALLRASAARGLRCANGLSMLVHQGARALEIWTKERIDAQVMMNAAVHHLQQPLRDA